MSVKMICEETLHLLMLDDPYVVLRLDYKSGGKKGLP